MARNLLQLRPIETVSDSSRSISAASRASVTAGAPWCSFSVPVRSRKASSIDSGSTSGVSARMRRRISSPASRYLAMFGLMTTASGQAASALNIGMAERTP